MIDNGLWRTFGLFLAWPDGLSSDDTCRKAADAGCRWIAPQLQNGTTRSSRYLADLPGWYRRRQRRLYGEPRGPVYGHIADEWREAAHRHGLLFGAWGVTYNDPEAEAEMFAQVLDAYQCEFAIVNAEYPYMDAGYWKSAAYVDAFDWDGGPRSISTLGGAYPPYTYGFDYQSWLGAGYDVLPQAYWNDYDVYEPSNCVQHLERCGVPLDRSALTVGIYEGAAHGTMPLADYFQAVQDAYGAKDIQGVSVYIADRMVDADYANVPAWIDAELAAAHETDVAPEPEPPEPEPGPEPPKPTTPQPVAPFARALYGPADPQGRGGKDGTTGDDVVAVKRSLSRAGFMDWGNFTNVYGAHAVAAVQAFQSTVGIQPTGNYGGATHSALLAATRAGKSEWAWDAYAIDLYRTYAAPDLAFYRPLYGPNDPQHRGGDNGTTGKDVEGVKRALSRAGYMEWGDFTRTYGVHAVEAVQAFQRAHGIDATGNYGSKTHEALRIEIRKGSKDEWAWDAYGIDLYQQATNAGGDGQAPTDARGTIVDTAKLGVQKAAAIHYTQDSRRMQGVREEIEPPDVPDYEDCSSYATWCYWTADAPDPNGLGYNGQGYTGTQVQNGKRISVLDARPGDLVFYGDGWDATGHVTIYAGGGMCVSHGSEGGPYWTNVDYRADILGAHSYLA